MKLINVHSIETNQNVISARGYDLLITLADKQRPLYYGLVINVACKSRVPLPT